VIVCFLFVSHIYCTGKANGGIMHVTTFRKKTGTRLPSAFNINFRRGFQKLLPWRSQTFAVTFKDFCRGLHKLLPWRSQTFAVAFTNFCRHGAVHNLLPCRSQTFAVEFTNHCSGYQIFVLVGLKIILLT